MQFPARFSDLPEYAFPRLRRLLDGVPPGGPELTMTIGEPRHPLPDMVGRIVAEHAHEFAKYPPNDGLPELNAAIAGWLARRYGVTLDPASRVMPLNGTREGLFNAALALCPERKAGARPAVLMPNPFYQPYGAAALAVGAEPVEVPATEATGFLPDYAALPPALLAMGCIHPRDKSRGVCESFDKRRFKMKLSNPLSSAKKNFYFLERVVTRFSTKGRDSGYELRIERMPRFSRTGLQYHAIASGVKMHFPPSAGACRCPCRIPADLYGFCVAG